MAPFPTPVIYSMEALNKDLPIRQLYPEDIYPNGAYYNSPYGRVRYWIVGPEDGRKITLVHGLTTPSLIWKDVQSELVEKGFRVLMYDVYGRGYSEAPRVPIDANLCIIQLALLLQYIHWDSTDLVGFSMGGAIVASFASMFPHLTAQNIVFIASAGLIEPSKEPPIPSKETQPDSGQVSIHLQELQSQYLPAYDDVVESSRMAGLISGVNWAFKVLGKSTDRRFLIVHGTADNVVPYSEAFKIHKLIPQGRLEPIQGGSHFITMEPASLQPFLAALLKFLA
ncbi:alpha/beta-hydrolase [Phanerochaete sordida]|uniref:Alpha/beta-hydrolase n=1 Tax=Phanerochaete sordida TaxID=48140 RepID=A0A9P3FWZ4_9APHY|nr:alpha/beta-hydrolase [Phanerochaete sordida]